MTCKALKAFLLVLFSLMLLSGCTSFQSDEELTVEKSKTELENVTADEYFNYWKLWNVDIEQEGYRKENASYRIVWIAKNLKAYYSEKPSGYSDDSYEDAEVFEKDGIEYLVKEQSIHWDSYDLKEGGLKHFRSVTFIKNDIRYSLNIEADNDKGLLLPIEECVEILCNPEKGISGMEEASKHWYVGFKKERVSVHVSIFALPYGAQVYNSCSNMDGIKHVEDGEIVYYLLNKDRTADEPNSAAVYWLCDFGLIEIRAGVPYSIRNEVPSDELDFITIELAQEVVRQLS